MDEKEFPIYVDAESASTHAHDDIRSKRRGTADSEPSSHKTAADETIAGSSGEKDGHTHPPTAKHPPVTVPLGGVTRTKATAVTATATPGLSRTMSRIRSRDPGQVQAFTHPLEHVKTGQDSIVDFDGPDDPYRPTNWPAKKKWTAVALYGL